MSYRKFVVISPGRSGSSLLMSLLDSHPNVITFGEEFGSHAGSMFVSQVVNNPNRDHTYITNHIFSTRSPAIHAVGFKLLYHQGRAKIHPKFKNDVVWGHLQSMADLRIIHLWREDYLALTRSREVAKVSNNWESKNTGVNTPVKIDPNFCQELWKFLDWGYNHIKGMFPDHPFMEITYENLKNNSSLTCRGVLDFLGLRRMELSTSLKKQNTSPLNEGIENYDELKTFFKATKWGRFFRY